MVVMVVMVIMMGTMVAAIRVDGSVDATSVDRKVISAEIVR